MSDAIAMGRVTIPKLMAGSLQGCILGMACNAVGINISNETPDTYVALVVKWPWLATADQLGRQFINVIYTNFDLRVMNGTMTLDQLIDFVRSVEPTEAEPSLNDAIAAIEESSMGVKISSGS